MDDILTKFALIRRKVIRERKSGKLETERL